MKKITLLIVMLNLFQHLCFAQKQGQEKIDSLKRLMEIVKIDSVRMDQLNNLSYLYYDFNIDSTFKYANDALKIAENLNSQRGKCESLLNIGISYDFKGLIDSAILKFSQALTIAEANQLLKNNAKAEKALGIIYTHKANYLLAASHVEKAIELATKIGDTILLAQCYGSYGTIESSSGNYPKALKNYFIELSLFEKIKNTDKIISTLGGIALVYDYMGQFDKALEFHFRTLNLALKTNSKRHIAGEYSNIARVYREQQKFSDAIILYLKSLKIYDEMKNEFGKSYVIGGLGVSYLKSGKYDEAKKYINDAIDRFTNTDNKRELSFQLQNLGEIYFHEGNTTQAIEKYKQSLTLAIDIDSKENLQYAYDHLADAYSKIGNYKEAYESSRKLKEVSDFIYNNNNTKKITQMEMQYDFDKKEAFAKAEQDKKDAVAKAELQKQKVQKYSFIGGALLLLALALVLYNRYRLKQRSNKLLGEKNEVITQSYNDLKKAQGHLVQSEKMASLGQLTAGVAHEINNPINFVSANIKPLQRNFDDIKEVIGKYESTIATKQLTEQFSDVESFKKQNDFAYTLQEVSSLLKGIEEGAHRTTEIVKGLRNFSRMDEGEKKKVNINEGIESTLLLINNLLNKKNIEVVKSYAKLPQIDCFPGQMNQVFMNILINAIDAIGKDGKISITTSKENNQIKISIRDTGKGMSEEIKQKIFDPFFTTKDVGKGTGLGLSISYGIIEKHNGKIEVKSEIGKGSEFIVNLPET